MITLAGSTSPLVRRRSRAALLAAVATSLVVSAGTSTAAAPGPSIAGESEVLAARSSTSAGTLVYIKNFNVWIARGNATGARALTKNGTKAFPYGAPSQSDGGIVVASYNRTIVRMNQQGRVLNTMDPAPLRTGSGDDIDGTPIDLAISPDGARIAYTFSQVRCSNGAPCSATGYTEAARFRPIGNSTQFWDPSWVSNTRTLETGGWGSQVQLHDQGAAPVHWFSDSQMFEFPLATDLGDTELSPDGRHLAAIRGYGEDTAMAWYDVRGSAKAGPPPGLPSLFCFIPEEGISGPTWAPDSDSLAWQEDDGIWSKAGVDDCSATQRLLVPGGSEPDWSPAALSAVVVRALVNRTRPAIAGATRVGARLTSSLGRWSPAPASYSFVWLRNGKAIKGGTRRTYQLTRADRGKRITVRVTARRSGFLSKAATSPARSVRR
ncbi:hypothetical protein ASE01_08320 [Nocardioides sp. Root190]|uniref:hypothetical protein n=1 Tax=Nocardioides sp. Root190 TaxID=1736488 RepID=UPI0007020941|nr:hypothetical protein [Nocardioides sp. Root190]KRB78148.1 hypothetical protein ASE01_08320 [Nocardioides sp. Root190]